MGGRRRPTPDKLGQYPFVLPPRATIIRHQIDRFLIAQGIEIPADTVETTVTDFGGKYARPTNSVWLVPYGAAARDLADKRLIELAIRDDSLEGPVGLTRPSDGALGPAATLMVHGRVPSQRSPLGNDAGKKAIWPRTSQSVKQAASRKRPVSKGSKKRNV